MKTDAPAPAARLVALLILVLGICVGCSRSNSLGYDPSADPDAQLQLAIAQARQEQKRILLVSGGDWCRWCHVLHDFLHDNAETDDALKAAFVVVKVYVGEDNMNMQFFSRLPATTFVPHFWILSADGTPLGTQDTAVFESGGDGYDNEKFLAFIRQWRG